MSLANHFPGEDQERYRRLVDLSPVPIAVHSEGKVVYVNDAAVRLFGAASADELLGKPALSFVHPDYLEVVKERIRRIYDEVEVAEMIEERMVRLDGRVIDVEVAAAPIRFRGERAVQAVLSDITNRKRAEAELAESRRALATLMSNLPGMAYRCRNDRDWNMEFVSEGCTDLTGFAPADLIDNRQISYNELIHPDDRERIWNEVQAALGRNAPFRLEYRIVTKNGREKWVWEQGRGVYDEQGGLTALEGFITDTTDLKRAEQSLREERDRAEAYLNIAGVMFVALNGSGEVTLVNRKVSEVMGYLREEMIGRDWFGCFLPERLADKVKAYFLKVISGDLRPVEFYVNEVLTKNGEERTIEWHNTVLTDGHGAIIGTLSSGEDVTEQLEADEELRKLSAAVMQSANMICITDPNGVIEYVNPQFTRVTGYSLPETVGKPASILQVERPNDQVYRTIQETISSGKTWVGQLQCRRKNGEIFWERRTIAPIFDDRGHLINYLAVGEDITTEIAAQQKIIESDKMSAVGMLAAGVAHEFKNYLAGIIGNASFALTDLDGEGGLDLARETLSKVVELGEKANDVAMSLLSYSKAKGEDFGREDLRKIIARSISLVEKEMKSLSIDILTYFEEAPELDVSASKIQQLLLNLLINAQHAIKSDGVITVALLRGGDHVTVKVGDTGCGIPPENLNRIFDPFFSTKGVWGKDEVVGTGMGLAICRNIAREHRGDLTADSMIGVGTTFTLTLPLGRAEEIAPVNSSPNRQYQVLIFSLDKSIVSHYFQPACEAKATIRLIDDVRKLPADLRQVADLVVCDARFAGKVELYKTVNACARQNVPYVMINCGMMEYQLAELFEGAQANYKQLPEFTRLAGSIRNKESVSVS
ncbi:MAG TPA: PAS domain S-box protein [Candidatus Deferrimicrobium sp.]|nr:PAS domain S-box protein [Candidatus Deferrimicrobium sp.]